MARFLGGRRRRGMMFGVGVPVLIGYLAGLGVIPERLRQPRPPDRALPGGRPIYLASERGQTGPKVTGT